MNNSHFPRTGMVVQPPPGFASEASGVTSPEGAVTDRMSGSGHIEEIERPSPPLTNPTDAVAEAARRVHYAAADEIEHEALALAEAANTMVSDAKVYASQLRSEGDRILEEVRAKTAHVQECSSNIRSHLSTPQAGD